METTSYHDTLVHVLPLTLRPNERLHTALNEFFIKPGSVEPRFLIKTMSSLAIDITRQQGQAERKALFTIRKELENNPFELALSDQLTGRRLANGAFRLYFGVDEISSRILMERQLEIAKMFPDSFEVHEQGPRETMPITMVLPASTIEEDNQRIAFAGSRLKKALSTEAGKRTYIAVSDSLAGHDEVRQIERSAYSTEQAS